VRRARPAALAISIACASAPAVGAPAGQGLGSAQVLGIEADAALEVVAKTMTNAVRQQVLDGPDFALNSAGVPLIATAGDAKCAIGRIRRPMSQANEAVFDAACLKRLGAHLGVKRFFWGLVYAEGGATFVRLHLWQEREGDRAATLRYDDAQRDRVAERLYRKLVTPDKVGDVTVSGQAEGELFVDGQSAGPYVAGVELTLPVGDRELEVRHGSRVMARGRASVTPGGHTDARLELITEPVPSPPPTGPVIPPPITVRPKASAWPWVLGSTAAAGLAGAGVFWSMRQGETRDLARACRETRCPAREDAAIDRANTWAALAGVSLGIGVAAGAGLAAYLLTPRRGSAPISGAVVPLAGGAAAGIVGSF
jgi:hypothetical protein